MLELNKFYFCQTNLTELARIIVDRRASFRFKAKGFSMSPFIRDSDVLTVSPLSGSRFGLGRLVAFIHPQREKLAIHRIVGKCGKNYLIKGDRLNHADGLVPTENIFGYVSRVERNGRGIFLGLGIERVLIAFLSRKKLLPLFIKVGKIMLISGRKFLRCPNLL